MTEADHSLVLVVPDAFVTAIAERVAALLTDPTPSPWLTVDEAASYLKASRQRIYDLVSAGELRPAKDGRRSLFRREWLDDYLNQGHRQADVLLDSLTAATKDAEDAQREHTDALKGLQDEIGRRR